MQLTGTKRLRDGRQMLPAGGYSEPTENQGIMDMETGEIIALSKKDQRIADAKKNKKQIMEELQAKVDKDNAEAAKPKPSRLVDLKGSEKQVAWAEKIRDSRLKLFDDYKKNVDKELARITERASTARNPSFYDKKIEGLKSDKALVEEFAPKVATVESASFWIDNFKGQMSSEPIPGFRLGQILSKAHENASRY